eukprot:EG_transcript_27998
MAFPLVALGVGSTLANRMYDERKDLEGEGHAGKEKERSGKNQFLQALLLSGALSISPVAEAAQPLTIYGAEWCLHCKAARRDLAPFHPAFVDCETEEGRRACDAVGVPGYPTITTGQKKLVGWPLREEDTSPYLQFLQVP